MPLLKLVSASKTYQMDGIIVQALKKTSLEINKGEFVALMGPSGSGKSTLMHLLGCLDTPTSGKIYFNGQNISQLSEKKLAHIRNQQMGFVFQQFNLIPRISALDNVSLPLVYADTSYQERKERSQAALEKVGLGKRLDHTPNQLSGGEQQRVAIARALVNQPKVILADEPTGNLDTKTGLEIMKILKNLHSKKNTIILVTHEEEIAQFAKRIIRIRDGEVRV
ncbi:ABC transporter ATP-binding protein [Patescibacteria group bacterium]